MMSRYRNVAVVGLVAGVLLASSGCSRQDTSSGPTSSPTATSSVASPKNVSEWTADMLAQAFTAIDAKIGAHPADYIRVTINEFSVLVQAIDPSKPANVDQYTYTGGKVGVAPVNTSGSEPGAIEMSRFSSDTVDPAVLEQVIKSAVMDSGVENGRIVAVVDEKFFADQPEPKIQVTVLGPRGTKSVEYDVAGRLLKVT